MKPNEQQSNDTTTTTSECDKQQQQHIVRKPTKLMVKTNGIEKSDMKKFLEGKRRERTALLGNENYKSNSAELHTQQEKCRFQRAQRTDEMRGRDEPVAMRSSVANVD